jgi:hypothetical chaperone protein
MIVGMDFGTTNTGAALFDGQRLRLFDLDVDSSNPQVCRSAIYMTRTGDYYLGNAAMNTYFAQNLGRPTRFRKVWVGEIMQVFAELPVFYRDVYIYEDEFSPGRLFTSIKTALRSRDYYGTAFRGNWFSASDLVAIFLMGIKMHIDRQSRQPVHEVVLGRPVHFSGDPQEDQVAQSRLLDAAFKAGFERVYLEYEPVAAALAYERQAGRRELVLVFDFGGGTLDFTIMVLGGRGRRPGQRGVLATGGIPIAGDVFDQRLFRTVIPLHLGEGLEYRSAGVRRPIPAHLFDTLSQPAEILSLNTPQNLEMLRQIHAGSPEPEKTHALLKVVSSNYALSMFDLVERAKQRLSMECLTNLVVETPDFAFSEQISRLTFERSIAAEADAIRAELLETLRRAGVKANQIDRVIRTGGSSQIPLFVEMLNEIFGSEKVQAIDTFSSVTAGLAIRAHQVASGKVELPAYTPDSSERSQERAASTPRSSLPGDNPITTEDTRAPGEIRAAPVDLGAVHNRLHARQQAQFDPDYVPGKLIFILSQPGLFVLPGEQVASWMQENPGSGQFDQPGSPGGRKDQATGYPLDGLALDLLGQREVQVSLTTSDEWLLLATNRYKLISALARDLYLAGVAQGGSLAQGLPLDVDEQVTAMLPWTPQNLPAPLICLITAAGQGRAFDAAVLAEAIASRPYFQLERRYIGFPTRLVAATPGSWLVLGTSQGRAARALVGDMTVQLVDLMRLRQDEWVSAAIAVQAFMETMAIGRHGIPLVFNLDNLPASGPPAQRGIYLRRNMAIAGLAALQHVNHVYALSDQGRLIPLRTFVHARGVKLSQGESLVGFLHA